MSRVLDSFDPRPFSAAIGGMSCRTCTRCLVGRSYALSESRNGRRFVDSLARNPAQTVPLPRIIVIHNVLYGTLEATRGAGGQ
jgi:hypothetical protein